MTTETTVSLALHNALEERFNDNITSIRETLHEHAEEIRVVNGLSVSIAQMAENMKNMLTEQQEQRQEMHEIHTAVTSINADFFERKIGEHDKILEAHEHRLREQEQKPQDSDSIACEVKALVKDNVETKQRMDAAEKQISEHKKRLGDIEKEPAENWKKAVWAVIAGVIAFAVGMVCNQTFGG